MLRREGYSERAIFIIDTQGFIRYVDVHDIDEQPDNDELLEALSELDPFPAAPVKAPAAPAPAIAAAPASGVTLYCTPWCPACRRAREFLRDRGVDFAEVDISRDREAAQRVRGWANGFETTPTIDIQGNIVVDFKKDQIEKLLRESKDIHIA